MEGKGLLSKEITLRYLNIGRLFHELGQDLEGVDSREFEKSTKDLYELAEKKDIRAQVILNIIEATHSYLEGQRLGRAVAKILNPNGPKDSA